MSVETQATTDQILLTLLAGRALDRGQLRPIAESAALVDRLIDCWQVLPSLSTPAVDHDLKALLMPADYARLARVRLAITSFAQTQVAVSRRLLRALQDRGVRYSLLKGSATGYLLYEFPFMRTGWDLDLAVAKDDLDTVRAIATETGYIAAQQDAVTKRFHYADPKFKEKVEATHYELGFLVKRVEVTNLPSAAIEAIRSEPAVHQHWFDLERPIPRCYASIDVHHALSLDIPVDGLLASAAELRVDRDLTVRVPDVSWLAAHLIFKLYWEGVHNYGKGLYEYADMTRVMPLLAPTAFERTVQVLAQYRLSAAGYYVLRRMPLFGVELPVHVKAFLEEQRIPKPGEDPLMVNDFGDMWLKLFGRR